VWRQQCWCDGDALWYIWIPDPSTNLPSFPPPILLTHPTTTDINIIHDSTPITTVTPQNRSLLEEKQATAGSSSNAPAAADQPLDADDPDDEEAAQQLLHSERATAGEEAEEWELAGRGAAAAAAAAEADRVLREMRVEQEQRLQEERVRLVARSAAMRRRLEEWCVGVARLGRGVVCLQRFGWVLVWM